MSVEYVSIGDWSSQGIDASGVEWYTEPPLDGFSVAPDTVSNIVQRPQSDGAFGTAVYQGVRQVSWNVYVACSSEAAAAGARAALNALSWRMRKPTTLVWHSYGGDRMLSVQRSGTPSLSWVNSLCFRYQQQAFAVDPFMYGETRQFSTLLPLSGGGLVFPTFSPADFLDFGEPGRSGQVQLFNNGTADAWPVFQVVGPIVGGLSITDTLSQRKLTYADDLSSTGQTLTITTRTGAVDVNGVDASTGMTSAQWTPVPPGESRIFQFSTAGDSAQTGVLTGTLTDTYI